MWVEANSKYKRYQYHSARVLHLKWVKSLGAFRKASRSTILWIYELTIDPFSLKTGRVVGRDNSTGALVNTTTLITIPALRILKSFFSLLLSQCFYVFEMENWNWNGKLKFSTHFPHSAFSTPRTPRFPPNRVTHSRGVVSIYILGIPLLVGPATPLFFALEAVAVSQFFKEAFPWLTKESKYIFEPTLTDVKSSS